MFGSIQIISGNFGGRSNGGLRQCHQMTHGGNGQPKCLMTLFNAKFHHKRSEKAMFCEMKSVKSHGEEVRTNVTKCHMGGEGV